MHAEAKAQRESLLRDRARHDQARLDLLAKVLGHDGLIAPDVYQRYEAREVEAIRVLDRALASLDELPNIDVSREIELLESANWSDFDYEAWRQAASLLIERVTVRRTVARGKPIVAIDWKSSASTLRDALLLIA
jgi:hypothetical protein